MCPSLTKASRTPGHTANGGGLGQLPGAERSSAGAATFRPESRSPPTPVRPPTPTESFRSPETSLPSLPGATGEGDGGGGCVGHLAELPRTVKDLRLLGMAGQQWLGAVGAS